jgi:hypothetical protein
MTCCALGDQDAILGHVASRGDRIPRGANKTRSGGGCQQAASDVFELGITNNLANALEHIARADPGLVPAICATLAAIGDHRAI